MYNGIKNAIKKTNIERTVIKMKKRTVKAAILALLCTFSMLFLSGCPSYHDEKISDARYQKFKELTNDGMSKEDANQWLDEHLDKWHPDYNEENSDKEDNTIKPAEEDFSFIETICGTYLVSGNGVLTGGALYDDDSPETTFTNLALHVSQADDNTVSVDVEGDHAGSGTPSAESPTVTYTDSMGYEVTVTFTVKDGTSHVDMKIFGDLSIADTGEHCTETVILSGEK